MSLSDAPAQIMLGVVMALTAVTLFLVVALLAAKVKRRKRVKADHVMPLSEFRDELYNNRSSPSRKTDSQ